MLLLNSRSKAAVLSCNSQLSNRDPPLLILLLNSRSKAAVLSCNSQLSNRDPPLLILLPNSRSKAAASFVAVVPNSFQKILIICCIQKGGRFAPVVIDCPDSASQPKSTERINRNLLDNFVEEAIDL